MSWDNIIPFRMKRLTWQVQFNCLLNAKNEIKYLVAVNTIYYDHLLSIDLYNLFVPFSLTGWIIKLFFSVSRFLLCATDTQYLFSLNISENCFLWIYMNIFLLWIYLEYLLTINISEIFAFSKCVLNIC